MQQTEEPFPDSHSLIFELKDQTHVNIVSLSLTHSVLTYSLKSTFIL